MEIDGRQWATRGEAGPSVSNLAPQPPPSKVKPTPGEAVNLDEIGRRTFHQRKRRYQMALRLLAQLQHDDLELARRVKEAQRAPYPGGGAEGSRRSGISDPTGAAVVANERRPKDPAELAMLAFDRALQALSDAETHRRKALFMSQASGTILKEGLEQLASEEEQERLCPSCAKVGMRTPRGSDKEVGSESPLCGWCRSFERDHGRLPPRKLLQKRKDGERIYAHEIELVMKGDE